MTWRVHCLETAELDVPRPLMVWREGWTETVRVQALAWLIEDGKDAVLVDTGVGGIDTRPDLPQRDFGLEGAIWTPTVKHGILGALRTHGLVPSDISHVIVTHLHFDHVGNVPLFSSATVHVSAEGLEHAAHATHPLDARYPAEILDWMVAHQHVNRVGAEASVLPGIEIRHLGGHTRCSQGVVVKSTRGTLVLPGDVIPLFDNLDDARPTGNYHHLAELIDASRRARSWGTVLPSHDLETPNFLKGLEEVA